MSRSHHNPSSATNDFQQDDTEYGFLGLHYNADLSTIEKAIKDKFIELGAEEFLNKNNKQKLMDINKLKERLEQVRDDLLDPVKKAALDSKLLQQLHEQQDKSDTAQAENAYQAFVQAVKDKFVALDNRFQENYNKGIYDHDLFRKFSKTLYSIVKTYTDSLPTSKKEMYLPKVSEHLAMSQEFAGAMIGFWERGENGSKFINPEKPYLIQELLSPSNNVHHDVHYEKQEGSNNFFSYGSFAPQSYSSYPSNPRRYKTVRELPDYRKHDDMNALKNDIVATLKKLQCYLNIDNMLDGVANTIYASEKLFQRSLALGQPHDRSSILHPKLNTLVDPTQTYSFWDNFPNQRAKADASIAVRNQAIIQQHAEKKALQEKIETEKKLAEEKQINDRKIATEKSQAEEKIKINKKLDRKAGVLEVAVLAIEHYRDRPKQRSDNSQPKGFFTKNITEETSKQEKLEAYISLLRDGSLSLPAKNILLYAIFTDKKNNLLAEEIKSLFGVRNNPNDKTVLEFLRKNIEEDLTFSSSYSLGRHHDVFKKYVEKTVTELNKLVAKNDSQNSLIEKIKHLLSKDIPTYTKDQQYQEIQLIEKTNSSQNKNTPPSGSKPK